MTQLFWLIPLLLVCGALLVAAVGSGRRLAGWLTVTVALAAGLLTVWLAVAVLAGGGPVVADFGHILPVAGLPFTVAFRVDGLSAIFLLLLGTVPFVAALCAAGGGPGGPTGGRFGTPFLLLTAAMVTVVTADDWVLFLFAWELMTLASYFLVIREWGQARSLRAGWVYLLTTHVAGGGILVGATVLSLACGSYGFAPAAGALGGLGAGLRHLVISLFALGFATKAGIWPLSFWLPEAYGVAPPPASAAFSGLMAKMGLYGLMRLFLFILPGGEPRSALAWGLVIATLGAASMLVGNLRAMSEQHAGRLVAQSSIGQMGYAVFALGMAVALAEPAPALAALAFAAAVYHAVNHTAFKALLFLTVGTVQRRTGTQDLRQMGGLAAAMPWTALLTLVGALAIAGTPPLNGFASKWLIYRAAIFGGMHVQVLAVYGVLAIFLSTVSLAAYLKYFGTAFLGAAPVERPGAVAGASPAAREAREPWTAGAAQGLLALACVALGLWPRPVVAGALGALSGSTLLAPGAATADAILGGLLGGGAYQPVMILLALALGAGLTAGLWSLSTRQVRAARPWLGGEEELQPGESRYGSGHLYLPLLARFSLLLRAIWTPRWAAPPWLARLLDLDRWLLRPVTEGFLGLCRRASDLDRGRLGQYLAWQLVTVVAALALLIGLEGGWTP